MIETIPEDAPLCGWHFVAPDRRLTHGDGRLVEIGRPLSVDPAKVRSGTALAVAVEPLDGVDSESSGDEIARVHAWGQARRVRTRERLEFHSCEFRRPLWIADASPLIRRIIRDFAAEALARAEADGHEVPLAFRRAIEEKAAWLLNEGTFEAARQWFAVAASMRSKVHPDVFDILSAGCNRNTARRAAGDMLRTRRVLWGESRHSQNRELHDLLMALAPADPAA